MYISHFLICVLTIDMIFCSVTQGLLIFIITVIKRDCFEKEDGITRREVGGSKYALG